MKIPNQSKPPKCEKEKPTCEAGKVENKSPYWGRL